MSKPLRVLIVEDSEDDAELLMRELRSGGYEPASERVDTPAAMQDCLTRQRWDIVISDYAMPCFSAPAALNLLQSSGFTLPFIIVSGAIGEHAVVAAMKAGAHDCVMKGDLTRLTPAIDRELREAALRREHRLAEEALRESEERYALAARGANDGLWDWNLKTNQVYFSPRWKSMLGRSEEEIACAPEDWFNLVHPDDIPKLRSDLTAHLEGATAHFENEHRMLHKDGGYRWVLTRGLAVRDADGRPGRLAGSQTDVTDRRRIQDQLLFAALHDALTRLPNRALLMELLERALGRAKRRKEYMFAVLFIDIDRFKVVNDSLGHLVGDQLLVEISRRLEHVLRAGDTVARVGGDEFTILLEDIKAPTDASLIAERVQHELATPFNLAGQEVFTTASIGIALSSTGYSRPEDLLRDADTAMYRAKAMGKARHEVFDVGMRTRALARLSLETDLRRAVEREEFHAHYQPIVSLETYRITGFEALVRWKNPNRGVVLPAEFVPVAEETGLIVPIDLMILRQACRQAAMWQSKFKSRPPLAITVNLSSAHFKKPDLLQQINRTLEESGLDPHSLRLEITESTIMEKGDTVNAMLGQLKSLNIQLYVDDFGTGYSSLSYLNRFPIDTLKIDRSFISRIGVDDEGSGIVRAIMTLARTLGLEVIAEGVETMDQLAILAALDCKYAQGFLFSGPVESHAVGRLIALGFEQYRPVAVAEPVYGTVASLPNSISP